jgi:hypothetical protein
MERCDIPPALSIAPIPAIAVCLKLVSLLSPREIWWRSLCVRWESFNMMAVASFDPAEVLLSRMAIPLFNNFIDGCRFYIR